MIPHRFHSQWLENMVIIIVLVTSHHITSHDCNDPHYPDHHHTLTSLHLHKARPPLPRAAVEDRGRSWHCSNNYQTSATVGLDSIVDIPSSTSSLSLFSLACLSVFAIVVMIIVFAILIIAKKEEPTLNKARNQVAAKRSGNPFSLKREYPDGSLTPAQPFQSGAINPSS